MEFLKGRAMGILFGMYLEFIIALGCYRTVFFVVFVYSVLVHQLENKPSQLTIDAQLHYVIGLVREWIASGF